MKVTIIIPIFNAELYLKECIESILSQSYKNIELILVNDGSTDDSIHICEYYSKIDNRIKIINQSNMGVSSARNAGIKAANGDIIVFIDSDDYVDCNHISLIVENFSKGSDMVCFGFKEIYTNKIRYLLPDYDIKIFGSDSFIKELFSSCYCGGYLWNKAYRTDLIKKNNIVFSSNTSMCEDLLFNINYLQNSTKVIVRNYSSYNYRIRFNSISSSKRNKTNYIIYTYEDIRKVKKLYNNYKAIIDYYFMILICKEKQKNDNHIIEKINEIYYSLLKNKDINFKMKIKLIILKRLNFLYKFYMKIKLLNFKAFE